MKVILNQDVKGQGKKGDLIDVSDGYARNFLLPKNLAKEATKENINVMQGQQNSAEYHKQKDLEDAQALAAKIGELVVSLKAKAGENGKIFGSVTSKDIADNLSKQHSISIDKKKIVLPDGIKEIGTFNIDVKLYPSVVGKIKVCVEKI